MSNTHSHGRNDLAYARQVEAALLEFLRDRNARHETLVIATVGEVRIAIDAADEKLKWAIPLTINGIATSLRNTG